MGESSAYTDVMNRIQSSLSSPNVLKSQKADPESRLVDSLELEDTPRLHRKGHRRAQSESLILPEPGENDVEMMEEDQCSDKDCSEDLFSLYIDMDKINSSFNSPVEASNSRESWIKNLVDSSIAAGANTTKVASDETKVQVSSSSGRSSKRPPHHARSVSIDGSMLSAAQELSSCSTPTSSSLDTSSKPSSKHFHSNSIDGSGSFRFDLDGEARKISPNDKLAEIALADPKRAKRILANRQSAARSKERKVRYISELERKVQTLQTEATSLSAQLTIMQRDSTGLTNENKELKLRLQGMEQEAQLREALNNALRDEIQRLKMKSKQMMVASRGLFQEQQQDFTGYAPLQNSVGSFVKVEESSMPINQAGSTTL